MSRSFDALGAADRSRRAAERDPVAKPAVDPAPKQDASVRVAGSETGAPPAQSAAKPVSAAPESKGALVAVQSPGANGGFRRRFAGWLERFAGGADKRGERQSEAGGELRRRIEELEKKLAAVDERFEKQLAESEGRSLHLVEERVQSAHKELMEAQRMVAQRVVVREARPLRVRLTLVTVFALAGVVVASVALLLELGVLPR
jgi:hypothetical protein